VLRMAGIPAREVDIQRMVGAAPVTCNFERCDAMFCCSLCICFTMACALAGAES
jgi:hypothetical protein